MTNAAYSINSIEKIGHINIYYLYYTCISNQELFLKVLFGGALRKDFHASLHVYVFSF